MKFFKSIPKTVFQLGLVSLFNDLAKEMIYPIVPLFLAQTLGAGPVIVGLIEGVAESTASLLKVFSGIGADRFKWRKPFLFIGYAFSALFRPMIAFAQSWAPVLLFRFSDRLGKGFRSAPQDALIADVTTPSNRGASYGFHSAMDDAGQLLGPFLAGGLLLLGLSFKSVILLSAIPGILALAAVGSIQEKKASSVSTGKKRTYFQDWKKFGGNFKGLLFAFSIFTLGNSTDAFLLIRLSQAGISNWAIALLWGLHGGVRMLTALWSGSLSDRLGRKPLIISGWFYYALIYLLFALADSQVVLIGLFLAYGVFYGLCEPSEKALVADLAPKELKGTAFGYYNLVLGLGALPASLIFGFVGQTWGYPAAFITGASLAALASLFLFFIPQKASRPAPFKHRGA